ncbi:probable proteasome inhibitor isoform X2 [Manihot esculenta]|uniref:PI31 proteasome regulator N-terminal domain-containing protein n=1 Tax=Manihot esculenta TaxID=3983 RepID=A0A2C9V9E2_MANES|nr:probable proteasome inhibitor isoform X2 [Manihot esculenta]OAY41397.1 hypothetical protein MANES_09G098300v8 [Manihot esculenta]
MADEKSVMAVIRAARPSFKNNADKVVFAVHASFLAAGYVLTATGPPAFSDTALYSSSTDEVGIEHWNDSDNEYAFVYLNPEKGGNKVLVKCLVMDDKLLIDALADGASEPVHLEINVIDFVAENGGGNYSAQFKNMEKLVKNLDAEILTKLDGSSSKARSSSNKSKTKTSDGSSRGRGINEPGVRITEPAGPQIHPSGIIYPPVNPVGGSDLFPGPGAGMYPTRGGFGGGSMLLGPNDPQWLGGEQNFPGGQPGVPPGARFDPFGPPGVPGFEPNRFVRNPRRPGRDTHPDLEFFSSGSDFI